MIFIYEPLRHNVPCAMIRAWRTWRRQIQDESNVFIHQLEEIARGFSACEVQVFNLPLKGLGRFAGNRFVGFVNRLDGALMKTWPALGPMAANFNAVFTR